MKKKILVNVLIGITLLTLAISFQSCETDKTLMSKNEQKEAIYELAKSYSLNIEIYDEIISDSIFNVNSLSEIEEVFRMIAKERERDNKQTKRLFMKNNIRNVHLYETNTHLAVNNIVRLKSRNIESGTFFSSLSEWFYDLTSFNTSIKYEKDSSGKIKNATVKSFYSGASLYTYEQLHSASSISNDTIFFQTQGKESADFGFWGMTITETRPINTSGYIDTKTGTGEINTGGNGYWGN